MLDGEILGTEGSPGCLDKLAYGFVLERCSICQIKTLAWYCVRLVQVDRELGRVMNVGISRVRMYDRYIYINPFQSQQQGSEPNWLLFSEEKSISYTSRHEISIGGRVVLFLHLKKESFIHQLLFRSAIIIPNQSVWLA